MGNIFIVILVERYAFHCVPTHHYINLSDEQLIITTIATVDNNMSPLHKYHALFVAARVVVS